MKEHPILLSSYYNTCKLSKFTDCTLTRVVAQDSVQSFDPLVHQRDMRGNSAEILIQALLQEAILSSSGMGRGVHSLM